jgi:hypothetical protein
MRSDQDQDHDHDDDQDRDRDRDEDDPAGTGEAAAAAVDFARSARTRADRAAEYQEHAAGLSHRLREDSRAARERLDQIRVDAEEPGD